MPILCPDILALQSSSFDDTRALQSLSYIPYLSKVFVCNIAWTCSMPLVARTQSDSKPPLCYTCNRSIAAAIVLVHTVTSTHARRHKRSHARTAVSHAHTLRLVAVIVPSSAAMFLSSVRSFLHDARQRLFEKGATSFALRNIAQQLHVPF